MGGMPAVPSALFGVLVSVVVGAGPPLGVFQEPLWLFGARALSASDHAMDGLRIFRVWKFTDSREGASKFYRASYPDI
jgi:hypothetical protein